MWKRLTRAITTALVWSIRGYRLVISPLLPPSCRFTPTCSNYAIEALERKGLFTGTRMAAWRLLRCHPFHPGGYDPVEPPAGPGEPDGRVESGVPAGPGEPIGTVGIAGPAGQGGPRD